MTKITLQNIFDKAWQAFVIEKKPPGTSGRGVCRYLTDTGRKCAVGLCLPDGHPSQSEFGAFDSLVHNYPELFDESVHRVRSSDLYSFQSRLHDNWADASGWDEMVDLEAMYRNVAEDFGLTIPSHLGANDA